MNIYYEMLVFQAIGKIFLVLQEMSRSCMSYRRVVNLFCFTEGFFKQKEIERLSYYFLSRYFQLSMYDSDCEKICLKNHHVTKDI